MWDGVREVERGAEVLDAVDRAPRDVRVDGRGASTCGGAIDALGIKPRKVMPLLYVAVEGRAAGLPLFDSMHLLGRDAVARAVCVPRVLRIGTSDARG